MQPPKTKTVEMTEHERLATIRDQSQSIGEFVDWLRERGIWLASEHQHTDACYVAPHKRRVWPECGFVDSQLVRIYKPIQNLLAEFFDIDQDKLEREKREMLADLRKALSAKQIDNELGLTTK